MVSACSDDEEHECTVLDSEITSGDYARASIQMRVLPAGVDPLAEIAARDAKVIQKRTLVEDLEESITDTDARIAMLTATRDKLLEIEDRAADDVDSLIKVASELTRIQSELERYAGQRATQQLRVDKHLLTIRFEAARSASFLGPIATALSGFGANLSEGIADTVTAIAYLLPWSLLLFALFLAIRALWRRGRQKVT